MLLDSWMRYETGARMNYRARCIIKYMVFATTVTPMLAGCAGHSVKMIHLQSSATAECSGSGYGIAAGFSEGFVGGCVRAYENRGFVAVERLTAEKRGSLERRGLLAQ
jgi:hypothetical protein